MAEQAEQIAEIRAYSDKKLMKNRRGYGRFVQSLKQRGLVGFTLRPEEEVGVFLCERRAGRR